MADYFGEIGSSSNYVRTILKTRRLIKTSLEKPNPNPNFAEARDKEHKAYLLIRHVLFYCMFCFVFYCEATSISLWKIISLGGRWSDSKGSVINANDTPSFPFVYVIISVSWGTSLSTLTVESHPSFMSIFIFYLLGPEIYSYDSFKWKPLRCNYYVTSANTPSSSKILYILCLHMIMLKNNKI